MEEKRKEVKTKVIFKHELEVHWILSSYVPEKGEMVIYDKEVDAEGNVLQHPENRQPFLYDRIKFGDGKLSVKDLPFVDVKNIENGKGKYALQQIADNVALGFDFTGKNENATSYDSSLTGTIPYGATGDFASSFGGKSAAMGKRSHAEGTTTIAKGAYSHAEGDNSVTIGADSHAEGYKTTAVAEGSHTEGARTIAAGKYSHAEGIDTQTTDFAAHAEGELTHAYGRASHAEGQKTFADGDASHAEGTDTEANGFASHAEGAASRAIGESSHAEGNRSYAQGDFSHTEGNNTYAGINPSGQFFGESAHAEGENTNAYGYASHTEGIGTEAYGEAQHVQGRYNIDDPEGRYAHIVGNGFSNFEGEASNAHTLDWQGNAWYAGNVYVGGNNQDEGKKLLTADDLPEYKSLETYYEYVNDNSPSDSIAAIQLGQASYNFNRYGIDFVPDSSTDELHISAQNALGKGKLHTDLGTGELKYTAEYYAGHSQYDNIIYSGTKTIAFKEDLGAVGSEFDLVVETEEDFRKCFYMLHPNKLEDGSVDLSVMGDPDPDFKYTTVLVRGINFTENLGSSDLDLAIFQPSLRYVKFDKCTWNAKWRVSGKAPTTLKFTGTEYERAPGDLQLVIDGIYITENNIIASINYANEHPDKPSEFWGIGLRNIKGIINCTVDYPDDYKVVSYDTGESSGYTYSFKLTAQYFDYADNNKITSLWDGTNISNCHISEGIYRSSNCSNIVAMSILDENDALAPVELRTCHNLSNFKGDFMDMVYGNPSYPECTAINYATCDWVSNKESFDFIIESQNELTKLLQNASSFQNKRILLKNLSLNPGNITLTGASYVTFSNVKINEGATSLIGASVFECSGLRFASTKCRLAFKGSGNIRPRVYNMGTGASINNIIGYCMYENCDGVSNSIVHFADKTNHIHGCIVNTTPDSFDSIAGQDPWFRLCNDIIGIRIISEPSNVKFDRCNFVSHISSTNPSVISYMSCTKVDVMTCDNVKSAQIAEAPYCPKPNRSDVSTGAFALYAQKHDGSNASKLAAVGNESGQISLGSGIVPIRASGGHILVPITPTEGNHAISMQYLDSKGYQSYSQIESEFAKKDAVCPKPNRTDFTTGFALYAQKPDGSNGSKVAQVGNESGTVSLGSGVIPIRASNGQILVPITPTDANHAVSKQYLDSKLSHIGLAGYTVEYNEYNSDSIERITVNAGEGDFNTVRLVGGSTYDVDRTGIHMSAAGSMGNFALSVDNGYGDARIVIDAVNGELNFHHTNSATNERSSKKIVMDDNSTLSWLSNAMGSMEMRLIDDNDPYYGGTHYGGIYDSYGLRTEASYNGITIKVPRIEVKTQSEYDSLPVKDETIIYIIK